MDIIHLHYPLSLTTDTVPDRAQSLAIGYFDGVHLGHQNVIRHAVQTAHEANQLAAVMTFHPHPKQVLGRGGQYASFLTPLEEKIAIFEQLGVDVVYIVKFDLSFAAITPQQFVGDLLRPLRVQRVVVGFDFKFGAKGAGNGPLLRELCAPDIVVDEIAPLLQDGQKVSSTRIRTLLADGQLDEATTLLSRPYTVKGLVVHGEARGRTIGFPTANVELSHPYVIPKLGVYAIQVIVDGTTYGGVLNIGKKPTFHNDLPLPVFEAHLFDFSGDLYDCELQLVLLAHIRAERKFNGIEELIAQIKHDAEAAKQLIGRNVMV